MIRRKVPLLNLDIDCESCSTPTKRDDMVAFDGFLVCKGCRSDEKTCDELMARRQMQDEEIRLAHPA